MRTHTLSSPQVLEYVLPVPDGEFIVTGQLIGFATSQRDVHQNHAGRPYMSPGEGRCSACRWFEVRIIRADDPDEIGAAYVVHTFGRSVVPGERPLCRAYPTSSGLEIIEFLTVRKNGHTFIPTSSARAIAQAASLDKDIEFAYISMQARFMRS